LLAILVVGLTHLCQPQSVFAMILTALALFSRGALRSDTSEKAAAALGLVSVVDGDAVGVFNRFLRVAFPRFFPRFGKFLVS